MAFKRLIMFSIAGVLLASWFASAKAETIRTGPNGNSATTIRNVDDDGVVTRTTTGSNGNEITTVREGSDGVYTRTTTGPNGRSATGTHEITLEEGVINRTSTGPRGNGRSVIRRR
ncbi:MAG: hypothetical protein F6K11_14345 [Leptolyngbya sp. SIO3F4]|nr:hypothetical protein [Leptolyngbya sp. SIO3F4]